MKNNKTERAKFVRQSEFWKKRKKQKKKKKKFKIIIFCSLTQIYRHTHTHVGFEIAIQKSTDFIKD